MSADKKDQVTEPSKTSYGSSGQSEPPGYTPSKSGSQKDSSQEQKDNWTNEGGKTEEPKSPSMAAGPSQRQGEGLEQSDQPRNPDREREEEEDEESEERSEETQR